MRRQSGFLKASRQGRGATEKNTPKSVRHNYKRPPRKRFFLSETTASSALKAIASTRETVTPIPPHTFGTPQSESFWSEATKDELRQYAKERNIKGRSKMTKDELVSALAEYERGERSA